MKTGSSIWPRLGWLRRAVLASIVLAGTACSNNDSEDPTQGPDENPAPDSSVFLGVQRVFTVNGERFVLVQALSELNGQDLDPGLSLEISGGSRPYVYDGRIFVFDSETAIVTRYLVREDLSIVEDGRFSMAQFGVSFFDLGTVFVSPTRGLYVDSALEEVIVFNPDAMETVTSYPLPGLLRDGLRARYNAPVQVGDNVYMAAAWWDADSVTGIPVSSVAVLSAEEDRSFGIVDDTRCGFTDSGFASDGAYYVVGTAFSGLLELAAPERFPPPCILRLNGGTAEFDADYYVDLAQSTGSDLLGGLPRGVGGGRFLQQLYAAPEDPRILEDPSVLLSGSVWRWAVVSLATGQAEVLDDLPLTTRNNSPLSVIDGVPYVTINDGFAASTVFRVDLDSGGTDVALRSTRGQIIALERLR